VANKANRELFMMDGPFVRETLIYSEFPRYRARVVPDNPHAFPPSMEVDVPPFSMIVNH
jgi:hypothetical protein